MNIAPLLPIPEVKPAIEQIRGQWHQKVSPQRRHALAQGRMCAILTAWAEHRGEVGPEWRCYLFCDEDEPTSLVADVSYYSFERLPKALGERREQPTLAPDIAVEIFSPSDALKRLREKIDLYFAFGSRAVIVVDPEVGTFSVYDDATTSRTYAAGDVPTFAAYPDLAIDLAALFRDLG